jgi:hypothetical protein
MSRPPHEMRNTTGNEEHMRKTVLPLCLLAVVILLGSWAFGRAVSAKSPTGISAVKPILVQNCVLAGCHRTANPAGNLRLEMGRFPASVLDVPSGQVADRMLVDTKAPMKSYLLAKIKGEEGIAGDRMPLNRTPLSEKQIEEIETWINSLKGQ